MNDPAEDIVAELARLRPCPPSERLVRRLEQALDPETTAPTAVILRPRWFRWSAWAAAAVVVLAAAVAVALKSQPRSPARTESTPARRTAAQSIPPRANPDGFRRVGQAHYLVDAADDGLIYASATAPLRKVRWQFLSASEWRNDQDRTVVQIFVPREETVLIPIQVH